MRLVADANILVAELPRVRGRRLVTHSALDLIVTTDVVDETRRELRRRLDVMLAHGRLQPAEAVTILGEAEAAMATAITILDRRHYVSHLSEAGRRVTRDPDDVPSAALALAPECGIWTNDRDFFGCGLPIWSTEVLQTHLEHLSSSPSRDGATE